MSIIKIFIKFFNSLKYLHFFFKLKIYFIAKQVGLIEFFFFFCFLDFIFIFYITSTVQELN